MKKTIAEGVKTANGRVVEVRGTDGAVHQIGGAIDITGKFFPLDSCKITEYDNADGTLNYIEAEYFDGRKWRQTFTYSATNPKRSTSMWTPQ